jgi:hypothetical protein
MLLTEASALVKLAVAPELRNDPALLKDWLPLTELIEEGVNCVLICMAQSLSGYPIYGKKFWPMLGPLAVGPC